MWFSPIKGSYMSLAQVDKTARVKASTDALKAKVKRGMFLKLDSDGTFVPYPNNANAGTIPYIALQDYWDYTAGAAGNIGLAEENKNETGVKTDSWIQPSALVAENGPAVTGVSVLMPAEYQTTAFKTTGLTLSTDYAIGTPLYVEDGVLAPVSSTKTNIKNIVGYVTKAPFDRWINDLNADKLNEGVRFTGGTAKVLQWATHFVGVTGADATSESAESDEA